MTPSGIKPATLRLVAQCLNQSRHKVQRVFTLLYSHLRLLLLHNIYCIFSETHDFLKEVIEMRVLIFSTSLAWNISQCKKNGGRYRSLNARVAQLKTVGFRNEHSTRNCTYKCAWSLIFWKCLESTEFICILLFIVYSWHLFRLLVFDNPL